MTDPMTVVVVEDDTLLRSALVALLQLRPEISVVGDCGDGAAGAELIRAVKPDIALVDIDLPGASGLEVAAQLREEPTRVVIVTRHARPSHLTQAMRAGAAGFVLKTTPSERLVAILTEIHAGRRYIDPEIAGLALTMRPCPLTERELDVLGHIHRGMATDEVAVALFLAPGTVRNYASSAMTKLGVRSGREAAAHAYAEGWI